MGTMVQLRSYYSEEAAKKAVEGLSRARGGLELAMVTLDDLPGCEALLREVEKAVDNVCKMQSDMHKIRVAHGYRRGY